MNAAKKMKLLRIYISTSDKSGNQLVYEKIVFMAKEHGMAGATVIRGVMGFGASSAIHSVKLWEYSEKLPIIVEIIDEAEKTENFFKIIQPILEAMEKGCMVTIEEIKVLLYKPGKK